MTWTSDPGWAIKNWPLRGGRSLPALRLIPGQEPDSWVLLPGLHEIDRCPSCHEWVPLWRWSLHAKQDGEHRAPERGPLARRRAEARRWADHFERRIEEEEAKIARYAVHGPSETELDMLAGWRDDLERYRRRADGDFGDQRDDVLSCAAEVYEPDRRLNYTVHTIEEAARQLGVPVERLSVAVDSGRVRTEAFGLGGPPYIPSFELERLRELIEHAAWRRRHQDDPIQRWLRGHARARDALDIT